MGTRAPNDGKDAGVNDAGVEDARATERALAVRCQAGDEGALSEVIGLFQRPLYGAIYPMLFDHPATEDVLQEAFVRFWRSLERFDVDRPIFPWLRRIAVNLALNRLAARKESVSIESAPEPSVGAQQGDRIVQAEEVERVEAALAELDENKRAVLTLRASEGMSYAEIADAIGVSVGTVMSRLFRARMAMREKLGMSPASAEA